jgi:hypothetical protein
MMSPGASKAQMFAVANSSIRHKVRASRHARELAHDEFEVAVNQSEIGSRLIGLSQRKSVLVRHAHVMPEDG